MRLPHGALTTENLQVGSPTLFEILADVMEGVAAVTSFAWSGRELGGPCNGVTQTFGISKYTKLSFLVLPLLLFAFAAFLDFLLASCRLGGRPALGSVIVNDFGNIGPICLSWSGDEISGTTISKLCLTSNFNGKLVAYSCLIEAKPLTLCLGGCWELPS